MQPPAPAPRVRLFYARITRILTEMTLRLSHTACSAELTESDTACAALCDADTAGTALVETGPSPLYSGTLSAAVRAVRRAAPAGDALFAVADPFWAPDAGGTECDALTLVAPVPDPAAPGGPPVFYLALRAHHPGPPSPTLTALADGGRVPVLPQPDEGTAETGDFFGLPPAVGPRYLGFQRGGLPPVPPPRPPQTIDEEGLRLPPTPLTEALIEKLAARGGDAGLRIGDLRAHAAALRAGQAALRSLLALHGAAAARDDGTALRAATAALAAAAYARIPDGVYAFADSLDDDSAGGEDLALRVTLRARAGRLSFQFHDTADAALGPASTVRAVTEAAVRYALRLLLPADAPVGDALLAPVEIALRPGSLLAAAPPYAVGAGARETALRTVDVVLGALGQALPRLVPAASCGTQSAVTLCDPQGSRGPERLTLGGGAGGQPGSSAGTAGLPGRAACTHHLHTPRRLSVERLEQRLPVRVQRLAIRPESGGGGVDPGGPGLLRELVLLAPLHVALWGERRRRPPYGLGGGGPGVLGRDVLLRDGQRLLVHPKAVFLGRAGDVLVTETPGGGGHGDPIKAQFFASLLP